MRLHLLHGIHNQGQTAATEALIPYLQGAVLVPDYGYILGVETKRMNPAIVGSLAPYIWQDDVLMGHSNGAAVSYGLVQRGVKCRGLVIINGALKTVPVFPEWVKFVHVYFNEGDDITEVASVAEDLPISPVDPNWGAMGHFGYTGTDPRVLCFDCGKTKDMPVVSGHGDIFTAGKIEKWGPFIQERLAEAY